MIQPLLGIGASIVSSKVYSHLNSQRITILHALPGRLRLQCKEWKNSNTATHLENNLIAHPLIEKVTASSLTGSLLLEFTRPQLSKEELDEILNQSVECTRQTYLSQEPKVMHHLRNAFSLINARVKKQTKGLLDVNSFIILLLLGMGLRNLKRNKAFSASLFFWAYSMFINQKDKPYE